MFESYSQYGEDLEILKFFGELSQGYYVDVGANNGIRDSNTALLEERGWTGLLIEANPDLIQSASSARANSIVIYTAVVSPEKIGTVKFHKVLGGAANLDGLSTTVTGKRFASQIASYGGEIKTISVPANTLDNIFNKQEIPLQFELLSIDVEGIELEVLQGLSLARYQPRLILIEDNSQGSDCRVRKYLKQWGYIHVHRTGVNDWYVRPTDTHLFFKKRIAVLFKYIKWWIKYRILKRSCL